MGSLMPTRPLWTAEYAEAEEGEAEPRLVGFRASLCSQLSILVHDVQAQSASCEHAWGCRHFCILEVHPPTRLLALP